MRDNHTEARALLKEIATDLAEGFRPATEAVADTYDADRCQECGGELDRQSCKAEPDVGIEAAVWRQCIGCGWESERIAPEPLDEDADRYMAGGDER